MSLAVGVDSLAAGFRAGSNAIAVPPLLHAQLETWRAAASGGTRAEVDASFPVVADALVRARLSAPADRQLWAERGATFLPDFLSATDRFGAASAHKSWLAGEVEFVNNDYSRDPGFMQAGSGWGLAPSGPDAKLMRLWVLDRLTQSLALPAPKSIDGLFQDASGGFSTVPMVQMEQGVSRVSGSDFLADVLPLQGHRLIVLQPSAGSLESFAANRLVAAARQTLEAVAGGSTAPSRMSLPVGTQNVEFQPLQAVAQKGLALPFNRVNADLHALDGRGGSYAVTNQGAQQLAFSATGVDMTATQSTTFNFAPENVNDSGAFGNNTSSVTATVPPICPRSTPDLKPFFILVVNPDQVVAWMAAIVTPNGLAPCLRPPG